jgi:hypothetical protein
LKTGKWSPWAGKQGDGTVSGEVVLDPAGAALLRWQ